MIAGDEGRAKQQCPYCKEWCAHGFCGRCERILHDEGRATCDWAIDDLGGDSVYETQCGHAFQFNDGGPTENGFEFCGYCGKRIVEVRTSQETAHEPV
jgi:hypothetical protein